MNRNGAVRLFIVAFLPALLAAGPQVTVHKIDESKVTGALASLKDGIIVLSGPDAKIALEDLAFLDVGAAPATSKVAVSAPAGVHKLTGQVIGTNGSWNDDGSLTKEKAFDGDLATYFDAPQAAGDAAWVGLDLGAPKVVTQIRFAPRDESNPYFQKRMVGGHFQGSSSADFSSGATDLLTLTTPPPAGKLSTLPVKGAKAFRYVRYIGPQDGNCNVAEIEFWGSDVAKASTAPPVRSSSATAPTAPPAQNRAPAEVKVIASEEAQADQKARVVAAEAAKADADRRTAAVGAPADTIVKSHPPTTRPATLPSTAPASKDFVVFFSDEDRITGAAAEWNDKSLTVKPSAIPEGIEIPASALKAVWRGTPAQVEQAKALPLEAGPEDAAFVIKDAGVVAVRGVTLGLEGESLRFKFNDEERKIAVAKLVGVIFGGQENKRDRSFHQTLQLTGETTLSGKWTAYDAAKNSLSLETAWGKTIEIPFASVQKIRSTNGRLTSLSDLKPASVEQVPYFDRLMPYRIDKSLIGGTIKLMDGDYPRGISVHARCVLTYDLAGEYAEFKTKVGFQQPEGKLGEAAIRIIGDGKTLWEDPSARGDAAKPADVSVKIAGVKQLVLEVDFGKTGDTGARVVWANARLLKAEK